MKNLHKIQPYSLTDEDKLVIAGFFKHAYIPLSTDRRIKFKEGNAYYRPNQEWKMIPEWTKTYWRQIWIEYEEMNFDLNMVVFE